MRIIAAQPGPNFSVADVHAGWVEALRGQGHKVWDFNLSERLTFYDAALIEVTPGTARKALTTEQATALAVNGLYAELYKQNPELLLITSGHFVPHQLMDAARWYGTKVVLLCTEQPYELPRELELAEHADIVLLNDPTHIERFRAICPTAYVPHAYRPAVHHPGPADPALRADLAFIGTGYASRIEFFEAMGLDGLDVLLGGNWQQLKPTSPLREHVSNELDDCVENTVAAEVYRSARAGINFYRREASAAGLDVGWACGPREIEMAACGLFFLRDPRPESDDLFPMLPTFAGPEDAGEQLRWWLEHPDLRADAAEKAMAAVADRTFGHNAAVLMRLLETVKG